MKFKIDSPFFDPIL